MKKRCNTLVSMRLYLLDNPQNYHLGWIRGSLRGVSRTKCCGGMCQKVFDSHKCSCLHEQSITCLHIRVH